MGTSSLYEVRNERVLAATETNVKEIQKLEQINVGAQILTSTPKVEVKAEPKVEVKVEPKVEPRVRNNDVISKVEAADHGIQREGSLSLLDRIMHGPTSTETLPHNVMRNHNVLAAAKANKNSRWGDMEVAGIQTNTTAVTVSTQSLYDMRNERVIAAAKANKNNRWGDMEVSKIQTPSLYEVRNERVLAAAETNGKEIQKLEEINVGAQILTSS